MIVIGLLLFSLFVDGAGYIYRAQNHCPLTGNCSAPFPPQPFGWTLYVHRGLDLSGGTQLILQLTDVSPGANMSDIQSRAISVITRRVNSIGVSEPQIFPVGSDRIEVDLAGVTAAHAEQVIGKTQRLVYTKWVKDAKAPVNSPQPGYKPALTGLTGDMVTSANASLDSNGTSWVVNTQFNSTGSDLFGRLTTDNVNACPGDVNTLATANCPERHLAIWLDLTQTDINHWDDQGYVAQLLATKFLTDPITISPITGGQAQISGNFSQAYATSLAAGLNAGALPASIKVLSSTDIGASLGADSVKRSLAAGGLGLVIVILFMLFYYRIPGLLASVALLFYAGVMLMLFKAIPVTVSLAGMAGFILSVGMAVDANVLIFERFKEEMRAGRTIGAAVDAAVRRAWPAIRDSNFSTIITSTLLYAFGSGPVRGFAVTLLLGVLVSLVSSIIVTHNLLAIVLNFGSVRQPRLMGVTRGRA